MNILIAGAGGYIGMSLIPLLKSEGHNLICIVRGEDSAQRVRGADPDAKIEFVDYRFDSASEILFREADIAFYLIHSLNERIGGFSNPEQRSALNFKRMAESSGIDHVIFLTGIANGANLSEHLNSRKSVSDILASGKYGFTAIRAGIIIGKGSSSFTIMRDLVRRLPIMVAPKWLKTKSQPVAVDNVLHILLSIMHKPEHYGKVYDIGGPDVMTYEQMLRGCAKIMGLRRYIITVPFFSPRLSSYWLFFVTGVPFRLAVNLVDSMGVEVLCNGEDISKSLDVDMYGFEEAVRRAL